jgi:hypothetical protein
VGAALLLPFLRWLPEPKADVGAVQEDLQVVELVPFQPPK